MDLDTATERVSAKASQRLRRAWTEPGSEGTCPDLADAEVGSVTLESVSQLLNLSPVGSLVVDDDRRVVLHNDAASRSLNVHPDDLANSRFVHPIGGEPYELALRDGDGTEQHFSVESHVLDGLDRASVVVTLTPVDQPAGRTGPSAYRSGTHGPLTLLPNRELLLNRLSEMVRRRGAGRDGGAVIALDLERFGRINERFGTAVGDSVLRAVANRLTVAVEPGDYVGRIGGDEFAVLLTARCTAAHLEAADRVVAALSQPIEIDGVHHLCAPVLGVAELVAGDDEITALAVAEEAARRSVPGTPRLAHRQVEPIEAARARALQASLPVAVSEGQMFLNYQPIFSLASHDLVGLEALVRWEHPDDGLIAPDEFIRIADEAGSIVPLGQWIIVEVCEQIAQWHHASDGYVIPPVSINLTCRQLCHPEFRQHLHTELASRGLEPRALRFEVTEEALDARGPQISLVLRQLASDGFSIDLDEFGTGVSSVTQLQHHPISAIKLSRSFVARMMDDDASARIVLAGIDIGRALGLVVTAIGVETSDQKAVLSRWQCDQAQGFLLARPVNAVQAAHFFLRDPASLPPRTMGQPILRSGSLAS